MAMKYTKEQLSQLDKEFLIEFSLGMQDQVEELTKQVQELNNQMRFLDVINSFLQVWK